jgi:hypothetical protein
MKPISVALVIFFTTTVLQAQIPTYPYLYPQPYVSSIPYVPGTFGLMTPYGAPAPVSAFYLTEINNLSNLVERLQLDIERLERELQIARSQQAYQPPPPAELPAATEEAETPITLVFRDGQRIESAGYMIADQTLWFSTPSGYQRVALSALNVEATQNVNFGKGIDFPIPKSGMCR